MFLMIGAMGLSTIFQQVANLVFTGQYRAFKFKLPVSTIEIAGAYLGVLDLISLVLTAVILVFLIYLINKTKFGLNVRAIACNAGAARVLGVAVLTGFTRLFSLPVFN